MEHTLGLYKFLKLNDGTLRSVIGNHRWNLGEWYEIEQPLHICKTGFHASETPLEAFGGVSGDVVATVNVNGDHIVGINTQCWQKMMIATAHRWTQTDTVALAVSVAEMAIDLFDDKFPKDERPRLAINMARTHLEGLDTVFSPILLDAAKSALSAGRDASTQAVFVAADAINSKSEPETQSADLSYAAYGAAFSAAGAAANAALAAYSIFQSGGSSMYANTGISYALSAIYTGSGLQAARSAVDRINNWMVERISAGQEILT